MAMPMSFTLRDNVGEFVSHLDRDGSFVIDRADPVIKCTNSLLFVLSEGFSPFVTYSDTEFGDIFTITAKNRTVIYRVRGPAPDGTECHILEWPD